jgi:Stress responsive A/B Barrel Domain
MKKILLTFCLATAALLLLHNYASAQTGNGSSKLLRHIVIITFNPGASADSIKMLDNIYTDLSKSSFVKDFELGVNVSARDTGVVKHIYATTFASKEDMKSYTKNPEYSSLFKVSLPVSKDVTVVDYWVNK